jgi:uncharacterized protein (TIGR04255 family)
MCADNLCRVRREADSAKLPFNSQEATVVSIRKMSARRPVQITPCPIIDATAELRFESLFPAVVALGLGYKALEESFPRVTQLQTIPLLDEFRKANPILLYQAQYRFESEHFVALLGPNMFAVGVNGPYTRWPIISKSFTAALDRIKGAGIIGRPQRFGLKYTNFFPGNVLSELNIELEIIRSKITGEETFLRAIIPSHPFKIQIQLATDAKITAPKLQIDPSVSGTLLTVDSFVDEPARDENFLRDLPEILEIAHTKEKEVFFELLKDEFLDTLNPEFGEATSTPVGADSSR